MKTGEELRKLLYSIDRKGYPAYKGTRGAYRFGRYTLVIDHVQGDPFAAPSRVHVEVGGQTAGFPERLYDSRHKRIALQDHLIRGFAGQIEKYSFQAKGSGKSGLISVTRCGQEVLERSACRIDEKSGDVTMRFEVGFPANGRTINAGELIRILFDFLPRCVDGALLYRNLDQNKVEKVMELSEDQAYIREQLEPLGLVAFVADGAILVPSGGTCASLRREDHRDGSEEGDHPDRRRRLSREIYPSESAGDGSLSPYRRRRPGVCDHRPGGGEDPGGGRPEHQAYGYIHVYQ